MREIEKLDKMELKSLLNKLIESGDSDKIRKEFDVNLPNSLFVLYKCPTCRKSSRARIFLADFKGLNRYVRCPNCGEKTFASTIKNETALVF